MIASTACTRPDAPARKFALRLLPAQPPSPPPPAGWLVKQPSMLDAAVHRAQEAPGRNHGRPPPLEMQGLRVWRAGHWLGGMQRLPVHCLAFRLVTVAIIQETNGCGWLLAPLPASPRVHPAPQNTGSRDDEISSRLEGRRLLIQLVVGNGLVRHAALRQPRRCHGWIVLQPFTHEAQ